MPNIQAQANTVAQISENLAEYLPGGQNTCRLQNESDGSLASLFQDRILYYNPTDQEIIKNVELRPADFAGKPNKPDKYTFQMTIPPHSIWNIPLRKISAKLSP
jgi:hypothetical protein